MRRLNMFIGIAVIALISFGCSNKTNQFSPSQVVDNALAEADRVETFYGESEIIIENKGEQIEKLILKEWRDGDRVRVEVEGEDETAISVFDGSQFIIYDQTSNNALITEETTEITQMSMKEQAEILLELISESHDTEIVGDDEIAGRDTFHLKAEQKNTSALFGDQELWIDKESWLVLKMISVSGDMVTSSEYKEIDFNADITDDLFTIDLPDDVEFQELEDYEPVEVAELSEAVEKIGESFLYIPEDDSLSIDSIDFTSIDNTHKEANISYVKEGSPYFNLSIINSSFGDDEDIDLFDMGEEKIDVRGQDGEYFGMDDFRLLIWEENGLNYNVQLVAEELTLEEVQHILENMEEVE